MCFKIISKNKSFIVEILRIILILSSISILFITLLIILLLLLNGNFCYFCDDNCSFLEWIKHCMRELYPFKALFSVLLILLPIVIALEVFKNSVDVQECQALLDLKVMLNSKDNMAVHTELKKNKDKLPFQLTRKDDLDEEYYSKIDNYLGTIELINVYLKNGIITKKELNNQFGYRIDNIKNNPELMDYINSENYNTWRNLHEIIKLRNMSN